MGEIVPIYYLRLICPHLVLLIATTSYLFIGAIIFVAIERPNEMIHRDSYLQNVRKMQDEFLYLSPNVDNSTIEIVIDNLIEATFSAFEAGIRLNDFHINSTLKWNLPSAIFFTTTLLTSIGYGNLVPITKFGRLFCVGYASFGIPLMLITIADLAKMLLELTDTKKNSIIVTKPNSVIQTSVILLVLIYLTAAASIFTLFETAWSFLDSFYFCLITLTTVGFGDLVPYGDEKYIAGTIGFILIGLILTTLTVDTIGSVYIERIHAWGRGLDARSFLNAIRNNKNNFWLLAYVPKDIHVIPFIDCINLSKD